MTTRCRTIRPKTYAADLRCRPVKVTRQPSDPTKDALRMLVRAAIPVVILPSPVGSASLDCRVRGLAEGLVRLLADDEFTSFCGLHLPGSAAQSPEAKETKVDTP